MKHMKKILALVIAMVMVLGTMSMSAFAAAGDLTPTTPIKITGLETGDQVTLYKVIKWTDGVGWEPATGFESLRTYKTVDGKQVVDPDCVFAKITSGTLDQAQVKAITDLINASGFTGTKVVDGEATTGTSWEHAIGTNDAGMYIALVKPIKAGVLYNPMIVSANYSNDDKNNEIASSEKLGTTSIAKKETTEVTKSAPEYDHDAGDEVTFTITTTIPAYADVYTEPFFNVSDKLSAGLVLDADSITVTTDPEVTEDEGDRETADDSFKIYFNSDSIKALKSPSSVTITYKAKITTDAPYTENEENNTVTVEYSNNPNDKTGKGILKDGTNHYTFDIDGTIFGDTAYRTGELVKVGKDSNGSDILAMKELSNKSSHSALEGAVFGLYTDSDCQTAYKNTLKIGGVEKEVTWNNITSDAKGLFGIEVDGTKIDGIRGLDVGTYYFKEISAPAGYIKDTATHTINVSAVIEDVDVTETLGGQTVTYKVPTLKSYKITVDGTESSFTMTLSGPKVSSVRPGDSSTEIVNTKGVELPSTGGMGTTIFYIVGAILVIGAGVVLVTRRRMNAEK